MYAAFPDPYCYPDTKVLRNRLGIRTSAALREFEAASVLERAAEPLPVGRFTPGHYRAIHRHLFQDVYRWAGRYRTVRIEKGGSVFCFPENIPAQMKMLFGNLKAERFLKDLKPNDFASACASFLSTLNAIHPFRDGNGRSQLAFVAVLASRAGHPLDLQRVSPRSFLKAMIRSFEGDEAPLAVELRKLFG